jgi:hypothetical protein
MMDKGAYISDCGTYRYTLIRKWDRRASLNIVMLNPSTADADLEDPTIKRCISFAQNAGYGGIHVFNLFALRSTDPKELPRHIDPVGPENMQWLQVAVASPAPALAAWGANKFAWNQAKLFLEIADKYQMQLSCLGINKDGSPKHPLYVPASQPLIPWPAKALNAKGPPP